MTEPKLETSIRKILMPLLKEDGFSGSGRTFRRVVGDMVQVIHIQGSIHGGQFCINFGIQPIIIPDVLGNAVNVKKITEPSCEFRKRLNESGVDQWWKHEKTEASMDNAIKEAADMYCRIGRNFFATISADDSPIYSFTPEELNKADYGFLGFIKTKVGMALVLAKLHNAKGNISNAKSFAEIGLANIGKGVALKSEFKKFL